MQKKKTEKLWSLKIPVNINKANKEIKEYLLICENKLGIVPNILKTNTINKKRFDAFNTFYNRLMQEENFLKEAIDLYLDVYPNKNESRKNAYMAYGDFLNSQKFLLNQLNA